MTKTKYKKEQVEQAIKGAVSIKDVIVNLGLNVNPGNYRVIHYYAKVHGLVLPVNDFSLNTKKAIAKCKVPEKEYFAKDTHHSGISTKKRLLKDYYWENRCAICGMENFWNGKEIQLQIDHINGDRFNNELSNIRLLCPNCHSQTETFGNKGKKRYNYCKCGSRIANSSKKCRRCASKNNFKIDWPPKERLLEMLKDSNYSKLGRKLGVSDNAIRKHLKYN